MKKTILLTAFRGSSAEPLVKDMKGFEILFLPNDKVKDSELLVKKIKHSDYDYIISFGQRPNIKDKVHIETTARDGDVFLKTDFDYEWLLEIFRQNSIQAKLSDNAGTSFCNRLYWNGLRYLADNQNNRKTKMVFVHVPYEKNISDFRGFKERVFETIKLFVEK